jgi:hypothetical protein
MNEWEWQLLEDKPPLDSCEAGGVQLRITKAGFNWQS